MTGVLPHLLTNDYDEAFDKLPQAVSEKANFMSRVGVQDRLGRTHYMILLRTVGDWPFLAKAGCLKRSFSTVMRRVGQFSSPPMPGWRTFMAVSGHRDTLAGMGFNQELLQSIS